MGGVVEKAGDLVGDVVDSVGDALEDTWDVVTDAADWVIDTAESTVQGALDDPIKTIAQVAAVATQQYYLLPAIAAADVAASGGDIKDIAKAAAISYATQAVASNIAGQVGSGITVDDMGIPLLPADVAYHAAQGVAGAAGSQAVGNAAAGSATNAFATAVRGGDLDSIFKSAVSGGVAGGTSTALNEMGLPKGMIPVAGGAIAGGTSALLNGGDVFDSVLRGAAIGGVNSVLSQSGDKLKTLYTKNREALTSYFKSTEDYKTAAKDANDYLDGSYKKVLGDAQKQETLVEKIRNQFQGEKTAYEDLLDEYENNKNLYNETKDKKYADAANALVDNIEAAAAKANKTYSLFETEYARYDTLKNEVTRAATTYESLVARANQFSQTATNSIKQYEDTYGQYVNESLVFNQEMSEYTKDVVAKYVENTGEVPTPEKLKAFINSGKGVDEITQDIAQSDLGKRWAGIQGQAENTSKLVGSGLYNYQDTSKDYIAKAEQAFTDRNSDLGMFYQYKALENEINNNPNSIYARDEEGNIFDTVNGITYSAPDTYQIDPNQFKAFQTSLKNTTTGESGISDPVFAIANRKNRVEGTPGMGGQDTSGINDPKNSMKITNAYSFDDGTSLVTFEDGSNGIIDTDTGKIIRGDLGFTASQNPNLYAESAYAQALNKDKLPSWINTWMDASSQGVQKETGFASSQGLTATAAGTYKDPTGNEYKKVTIAGKDYLQDVKNPTGLYAIDGSGTATGGTSGGTTTGTASGTTGGSGTSSGSGATAGTGSGAGAGSGSGTQPGAGGTGGTGTLAGALSTADYIAKNDTNKDGIVNTADSIAATAALTGLFQQGQRQQRTQQAVEKLTAAPVSKAEPAKVVQGEQATLANLDTFKPETAPPAAAPTQPTGDLYFDESQVVNDNNFGTNQQAFGQQQPGQNLFFDESQIRMAAEGGQIEHNPEFFSEGGLGTLDNRYVRGEGDGTSDSVPAMLASGEFVIPADVVSGLGNGDNDAGAAVLDEFMKAIRAHKRAADPSELPEDSKGPLAYLQEAMEKVRA
jgi:glycerophosphoryl diester phosphodiesterase